MPDETDLESTLFEPWIGFLRQKSSKLNSLEAFLCLAEVFPNSTRAKISPNDSGKLSPSPQKTYVNISHAVDLFEILDVPPAFLKSADEGPAFKTIF